jgi:CheY-like chemotaxis protein
MALTILLVEDNEADVKITARAFGQAKLGTTLFTVSDGQECLDFIRHEGRFQSPAQFPRPDLILLDINMPKVDGFGVVKTLKSDERFKSIPIVMLSASKNEADVQQSYSLGANSFIQKPVDYEKFTQVIEGFNYYWQELNRLPVN